MSNFRTYEIIRKTWGVFYIRERLDGELVETHGPYLEQDEANAAKAELEILRPPSVAKGWKTD